MEGNFQFEAVILLFGEMFSSLKLSLFVSLILRLSNINRWYFDGAERTVANLECLYMTALE